MSDSPAQRFARQKRTVTVLGAALIVAGLVMLVWLRRVPLPLRLMAGLGDVFIGCVLLVWVRQHATPEPPSREGK